MSKKELNVGGEFDFDMNFDDLDFDKLDKPVPPETKNKARKVVTDVAKGAGGAILSNGKDPRFYRSVLRKAFPKSYGTIDDAVDVTTQAMSDLYNDVAREEKPKIQAIFSRLADMVPDDKGKTKNFLKKLGGRSDGYRTPSIEEIHEQTVKSTLETVFQSQQSQNKVRQAQDIVKARIEKDDRDRSLDVLNKIYQETASVARYNETFTQGYQKKSLEIQLRSYLAQVDVSRRMVDHFSTQRAQLEAVIKNTSLPEYAKITEMERIKDAGKRKMADYIYGDGGFIKQGVDRAKTVIKDAISGMSGSLSNLEMGIDQAASAKEQMDTMTEAAKELGIEPPSKAEMAGALAAGFATDWFKDYVAKKLKDSNVGKAASEKFFKLSRKIRAPGASIKDFLNSERIQKLQNEFGVKGAVANVLVDVLEGFTEKKNTEDFSRETALDELGGTSKGISNKANISLVDVIPGYLARIHREVAMLRTGQDQPLFQYDFKKESFVTTKDFEKDTVSFLKDRAKRSLYNYKLSAVTDTVDDTKQLNPEERFQLNIFMSSLAQLKNFRYTKESIINQPGYSELPPRLQRIIVEYFDRIESSDNPQERIADFEDKMASAKESIPSLNQEIKEILGNGGKDVLTKLGLVSRKDDQSGYRSSADDIMAFIHNVIQEDSITSDIKLKERIRPTTAQAMLNEKWKGIGPDGKKISRYNTETTKYSPASAFKAFRDTKLYKWFYKKGAGDQQQHEGPMAGDVNRAFGDNAAPDGRSINLQEMNAAFFASTKVVDERLKRLEASSGTGHSSILSKIEQNTAKLVELNEAAIKFIVPSLTGADISKIKDWSKVKYEDLKSSAGVWYDKASTYAKEKYDYLSQKGEAFKTGTIDPMLEQLLDYYNENKEPAKNKLIELFDNAAEMANSVLRTGQKFITETVPGGLKKAKDFLKRTYHRFEDAYRSFRDVYIPGQVEPILRGIKISAGEYYDQITGQKLLTMQDVIDCKNTIVDAAGNVILTVEDRANGLYDNYGVLLGDRIGNFARSAGSLLRKGVSRAIEGFSSAFGIGKDAIASIKNFFMYGLGGGGGMLSEESEVGAAVIDIRDILLGYKNKVKKRLKDKLKTEDADHPEEEKSRSLGDIAKDTFESIIEKFSGEPETSKQNAKPGTKSEVLGNLFKEIQEKGKAYLNGKTPKQKWEELRNRPDVKKWLGVGNGYYQKLKSRLDKEGIFARASLEYDIAKANAEPRGVYENQSSGNLTLNWGSESILGRDSARIEEVEVEEAIKTAKAAGAPSSILSRLREKLGSVKTKVKMTEQFGKLQNKLNKLKMKNVATASESVQPEQTVSTKPSVDSSGKINWGPKRLKPAAAKQQPKEAAQEVAAESQEQPTSPAAALPETAAKQGRLAKARGWLGGKLSAGKAAFTAAGGLPGIVGKVAGIGSMLGGLFGGDKQDQKPQEGQKTEDVKNEDAGSVLSRLKSGIKNKVSKKDRAWNDNDGSGTRDGGVEEQEEINQKLKEARTSNRAGTDTTKRYEGNGGIMGMAGKVFSMLTSGIGTIMNLATTVFSKIPVIGKLLTGGARVAGSLISGAARIGAKVAVQGAWTAARIAVPLAAKAAVAGVSFMGSAAMAVGGAVLSFLLSGPVIGVALAAGAAYGLYKLYKWANRNNANDVEIARLQQYGFGYNTAVQRYNNRIYVLEAYFSDGRVGMNGNEPYFIEKLIKAEDILEIFGIDPEDKESVEKLSGWLDKRFKPIFLTHIAALYRANKKPKLKDLADFDKALTPAEAVTYLEAAKYPSANYSYDISPINEISGLYVDEEQIQKNYEILIKKYREKAEKTATKISVKENKTEDNKSKTQPPVKKEESTTKAETVNKLNQAANKTVTLPDSDDGGQKPSSASAEKARIGISTGSLPVASGALADPSGGMQFINPGKGVDLKGLDPRLMHYFMAMAAEYGQLTGKKIYVDSAFRSFQKQQALHAKDPDKAAPPGRSLHEFGLALDISPEDADALEKLGLMRKYGFTRPVGREPWHIEPAGIQGNLTLAKKDMTARAQMIDASLYKGGGGYGTVPGAEKYRRNTDLALSLLNTQSKPADAPDIAMPGTAITAASETKNKADSIPTVASSDQSSSIAVNGGDAGGNGDGKTMGGSELEIKSIIQTAAKKTGVDPNLMLTVAAAESSLNPNARASGSSKSAKGLFQMKDATWKESLQKYGPKHGLSQSASPFDPMANALMAGEYLNANLKSLRDIKPNPNSTDAYMTHFLGPSGAKIFLSADPSAEAAEVRPDAASGNPSIFYNNGKPRSVSEVYQELTDRLQKKARAVGVTPDIVQSTMSQKPTEVAQPDQSVNLTQSSQTMTRPNNRPNITMDSSLPGRQVSTARAEVPALSTATLESIGEKTNQILTDSLAVLKGILENTSPENTAKIMATAMASVKLTAPSEDKSPKAQDRKNMGRDDPASKGALDMKRYSM